VSIVRKFQPEVRLKKLLAQPGGIRFASAIERADEIVESMRDEGMRQIDAKIEKLASFGTDDESLDSVYQIANEVFAEAGMYGLSEISEVARNLCQLVSARKPDISFPSQAIRVHTDSMRLLRSPTVAANAAMRKQVLEELRKLAEKYTG
jgi:hypothetical protein